MAEERSGYDGVAATGHGTGRGDSESDGVGRTAGGRRRRQREGTADSGGREHGRDGETKETGQA